MLFVLWGSVRRGDIELRTSRWSRRSGDLHCGWVHSLEHYGDSETDCDNRARSLWGNCPSDHPCRLVHAGNFSRRAKTGTTGKRNDLSSYHRVVVHHFFCIHPEIYRFISISHPRIRLVSAKKHQSYSYLSSIPRSSLTVSTKLLS